MARPGIPPQPRDPYLTTIRVGAIASAVVSGALALLAFIFGSPLQFGIAMAVCAGWWIADDLAVSTLGGRQTARQRTVAAERPHTNYSAHHPVFTGKRSPRTEPHPGSTSIAA